MQCPLNTGTIADTQSALGPQSSAGLPVQPAEEAVEHGEEDELPVQELVDAALPAQQQTGEGPEARVRHAAGVGHRHPC